MRGEAGRLGPGVDSGASPSQTGCPSRLGISCSYYGLPVLWSSCVRRGDMACKGRAGRAADHRPTVYGGPWSGLLGWVSYPPAILRGRVVSSLSGREAEGRSGGGTGRAQSSGVAGSGWKVLRALDLRCRLFSCVTAARPPEQCSQGGGVSLEPARRRWSRDREAGLLLAQAGASEDGQ